MTEDEALAQLRDIHLPADLSTAAALEFATWPFVALAIAAGLITALRLWNRYRWRRRLQTDLLHIEQTEDASAQWSKLLAFAKGLPARTGRRISLPSLAYRRPQSITSSERAAFIDFVRAELRR